MDESVREDVFNSSLVSILVKVRVRSINLYDFDSDISSLEILIKGRFECSERWVNLLDDTIFMYVYCLFCSDSSLFVNFNCSVGEYRGLVWVIFNDSISNDYLELKNDDRE